MDSDRALARGWPARARDNLTAIRLSRELEESGRTPTPDEQSAMLRFVGFGATELAQNCCPLPGASEFRDGWEETGRALMALVSPQEYAALKRATQYAHFIPEPVVRALWRAALRLGFTGGRVLEPGMGSGLFFALLPPALRDACRLTGIEYNPVTARIARLVFPEARVRCEDYVRSPLRGGFDLAIGNPPFADRVVRADPTTAALGLRLHDYFIATSVSRLRPGGIALFVTSTGTMDKANTTARTHIAGLADLIGAVRLPEASMRATAGTDVVDDVLVLQRRQDGQAPGGAAWIDLSEIALEDDPAPEDGHAEIDTDWRGWPNSTAIWHKPRASSPLTNPTYRRARPTWPERLPVALHHQSQENDHAGYRHGSFAASTVHRNDVHTDKVGHRGRQSGFRQHALPVHRRRLQERAVYTKVVSTAEPVIWIHSSLRS